MAENKKTYIGEVVSDKMDKTVTVATTRRIQHPVYNKIVKKTSRFMAHDEKNECGIGDMVKMVETRPLSKLKRFEIVEIIEKAKLK